MRHILVKPFGILTFDGMSMMTFGRNLNQQSILEKFRTIILNNKRFYKYINTFCNFDLLFTIANRFHNKKLPRRIAEIYYQLFKLSLKLNKTTSSLPLFQQKFTIKLHQTLSVQDHLPREKLRKGTERKFLYEQLRKH